MQEESVFTKIVTGQIPSHKIYEDDTVLAFLDIHPVVKGHTLVIPKKQIDQLWEVADADYQALMAVVKKVALSLRAKLGVKRVGIKVIGVDVPHAHVQLIPFNTLEEYEAQPTGTEPDHAALTALAKELAIHE